jgi:genome maintenance exonuclease 1
MNYNYKDYETTTLPGTGRIYLIDEDRPYPSITTILGNTQEDDKKKSLDAWRARVGKSESDKITNLAATRGTNTHLMLERALAGLDPKTHEFPKEHAAIFNSLKLELRKITGVHGQEVVLFSDMLGIAGRCDLVGDYQNEIAIIDYKTSSRVKSSDEIGDYWLQCCFYALAHNEMFGTNIKKMVILMGVENKMPLVFKKLIDDELITALIERVNKFYANIK